MPRGRGGAAMVGPMMVAMAAMTACAGHLPPCPAAGGPGWTEVQGPHFRVRTDDEPAAARDVLTDLERFQAVLLTVFGASPDVDTGRLPVVVVDRGWTDFAPHQVNGFFTRALFQPLIVMKAGSSLFLQEVIKHELVHYFSHMVMPRQPPWLSEGFATYYQTIEYDAAAGRITVGRPPPDHLRAAQQIGVSNLESMFAADQVPSEDTGRFYASAWITVHYLMNHRVAALAAYEKALHEGASAAAAWTAAFGAQRPVDLAGEVREYLDGGRYALLVYRFAAPSVAAPPERRLTDADTHATRALLYLTGGRISRHAPERLLAAGEPPPGVKNEIDEALRQEPEHVVSRALAHWGLGAPVRLAEATAARRKHGDDWLAWLLMAEALRANHDSPDDALERALDLAGADRSVTIPTVDDAD